MGLLSGIKNKYDEVKFEIVKRHLTLPYGSSRDSFVATFGSPSIKSTSFTTYIICRQIAVRVSLKQAMDASNLVFDFAASSSEEDESSETFSPYPTG
jgi:hypothetical protein